MANWIPFHDELRKGKYRGLKRGVRFVLLELSLEAKPGKGVIELPLGMNDIDAVCDILGGDRREVAEALRVFCAGDDPVVVIEGPEGARRLRIPGWERRAGFNGSRESPGASTKRTRALRERRRDADAPRAGDGGNNPGNGHVHRGNDVGNDAATEAQRPLHAVPATIGNGGATALQDRTGQDKDNPPSGGGARTRAGEPPPPSHRRSWFVGLRACCAGRLRRPRPVEVAPDPRRSQVRKEPCGTRRRGRHRRALAPAGCPACHPGSGRARDGRLRCPWRASEGRP